MMLIFEFQTLLFLGKQTSHFNLLSVIFPTWNACRMYQVLLASGKYNTAKMMLNQIPKDDPHVRCVIKACQTSYAASNAVKKKTKKKGVKEER